MKSATGPSNRLLIRVLAAIIGLVSIALIVGGTALVLATGSPYYVLAGLALIFAALLLWRGDARGVLLYGFFLFATLSWSYWEAGFDGWALMPRIMGPVVIGALMLLPGVRRATMTTWASLSQRVMLLAIAATIVLFAMSSAQYPDAVAGDDTGISLSGESAANGEWSAYGNSREGTRYSPLDQITPANVEKLQPAWTYRTKIALPAVPSPLEATPLMVGGTLYLCTQTNIVIALDAETGTERWRFDPKVDRTGATFVSSCRGVAFERVANASDCPERIITTTFDARLIALDAKTGRLCPSFGQGGITSLLEGLGNVEKGFYYASSAPTIVRGRVVVGGYVRDNDSVGEPSGVIRAYDVRTGRFSWAWDMGRPDEHGLPGPGETFTRGTPNSWAPMSADERLGLVYAPTGNATPDHWGAHRSAASERYASSVVAIDAETGALRWNRQLVHHDVWDYDTASQPTLVDLRIGGKVVPALIQATKQGQIYMFDRRNGRPLSPIVEKTVPHEHPAAGDRLSPTQPFSTAMPSYSNTTIKEADMWGLTPLDQLWCRIEFRKLRHQGPYTPPSTQGSLIMPGVGGGMNWGSVSVDPERGLLTTNVNIVPSVVRLIPRAEADARLEALRRAGKRMKTESLAEKASGTPFALSVTNFLSPLFVPCTKPPFGTINVIDLKSHKQIWSKRLGTARDSGPLGIGSRLPIPLGTPNFGGSVMTRSGLILIGATQEPALRIFGSRTGKELWYTRLPAGGQTTPMTYISPKSGRQFVLIVAGGNLVMGSPMGDYVLAFALPKLQ